MIDLMLNRYAKGRLVRRAGLFWVAFLLLCTSLVRADGLALLEQFLKTSRSGRAEFTQVVTAPSEQGMRSKTSSGSFSFFRPHQFRFDYKKPYPQTIVADGQTLWLYDPDLAQVTARSQSQALSSTPAGWLTSGPDLSVLKNEFQWQAEPDAQGLSWVRALPKAKDSPFQSIRIGLRQELADLQLGALEIMDAFGQKSVLTFARYESNPAGLGSAQFKFSPPKGVDLIRP
jgi:outer membrane lipoprotein carrier protein